MAHGRPTKFERLGATALLAVVWLLNIVVARVAEQFGKVFSGMDAALVPMATRLFIDTPDVVYVVAGTATVAFLLYWFDVPHMVKVQVAAAVLSIVLIAVLVLAMYLPIFNIGAAVEDMT